MLNQIIFIITASFLNITSMINLSFFSYLFQFINLLFNTNFLIYFVLFLFIIIFLGSRAGKIGKIKRDAAVTLGGGATAYGVYSNSGGGSSRINIVISQHNSSLIVLEGIKNYFNIGQIYSRSATTVSDYKLTNL